MAVHSFIRQFSWLIQRPVQPISIHAGVPLLPDPRFRFFSQSATPESVHGQVTVSCDADGRKMTVRWADGEQNVFHAVWLRQAISAQSVYSTLVGRDWSPRQCWGLILGYPRQKYKVGCAW